MSVDWGDVLRPQIDGMRGATENLARTLYAVVTDLKAHGVALSPAVEDWHKDTGSAIRRADEWKLAHPDHGSISPKRD